MEAPITSGSSGLKVMKFSWLTSVTRQSAGNWSSSCCASVMPAKPPPTMTRRLGLLMGSLLMILAPRRQHDRMTVDIAYQEAARIAERDRTGRDIAIVAATNGLVADIDLGGDVHLPMPIVIRLRIRGHR